MNRRGCAPSIFIKIGHRRYIIADKRHSIADIFESIADITGDIADIFELTANKWENIGAISQNLPQIYGGSSQMSRILPQIKCQHRRKYIREWNIRSFRTFFVMMRGIVFRKGKDVYWNNRTQKRERFLLAAKRMIWMN